MDEAEVGGSHHGATSRVDNDKGYLSLSSKVFLLYFPSPIVCEYVG